MSNPEPTPTTDSKGKKPLNKTTIIMLAAGGAIVIYLFYRKKRKEEETTSIPYSSQAFIPVTGENVGGAGATGSIGNPGGASGEFTGLLEQTQKENSEFVREMLKNQGEERREAEGLRREEFRSYLETIKGLTGGGAPVGTGPPSGGTPGGTPTPTGPGGQPAPQPPPTPKSKCGGSFPHEGPHGCYQDIKCGNGCLGHKYQSGTTECQRGEARHGNCHW